MGSMRGANPNGFIGDELFHAILGKLQRDVACRQLHFYNWTEPLLHPRIVGYCRAAADAGFHVHLSSNLNHLKDAEGILGSRIKTLRISLSGFTQATYAIGHFGGNIEKVKMNMRQLAEAQRASNSRTRIHVYFHKYRHNLEEVAPMEAFARELGFDFLANWAYLMPLEKVLAHLSGTLPATEQTFADTHFVPPPEDALRLMQISGAQQRPCELIEQLVLDHRGRAMLCCATFDHETNQIGEYLKMDWAEMQGRRYAHSMCPKCTACGAHVWFTNMSDANLREQVARLAERSLSQPIPDARRSRSGNAISLPILNQSPRVLAGSA